MNPVETVWRELVQRRLLPVAIVLIAALAAIPFLLAKDPKPVASTTPAAVAGGDESLTAAASIDDTIVSPVAEGERTKRRRVLGARKNPFEPAAAPKAAQTPQPQSVAPQAQDPAGAPAGPPAGDAPSQSGSSGGPTAPATPAPPASTPPAGAPPAEAPKPRHELYSLTVRFGSSEDEALPKMNLPRLKALPDADDPILVYLGLAGDAKTAVFMVDASVQPQGDGTCRPNPATCETIHLRVGDTEFFDVKDESGNVTEQYQLDLLAIKRSTTASTSKSKAARAKVASAGRKALRAREAAFGPLRYRYDVKSGRVRKVGNRAFAASVAHAAARAALASAGGFAVAR